MAMLLFGVQSGGLANRPEQPQPFPILPHAYTDRLRQRGNLRQPDAAKLKGVGITINAAIFRLHGYAAFRSAVRRIGEQTGATPTVFQSCHTLTQTDFDNGETYVSLMQRNLKALES